MFYNSLLYCGEVVCFSWTKINCVRTLVLGSYTVKAFHGIPCIILTGCTVWSSTYSNTYVGKW